VTHRVFAAGQKVRTIYGEVRTVRDQGGPNGCMVWLEEESRWWHPSKLIPANNATDISGLGSWKLPSP
jgi:hypothetical protein